MIKIFTAPTTGTYSFSKENKIIQVQLEEGQIVDIDELFKREELVK